MRYNRGMSMGLITQAHIDQWAKDASVIELEPGEYDCTEPLRIPAGVWLLKGSSRGLTSLVLPRPTDGIALFCEGPTNIENIRVRFESESS